MDTVIGSSTQMEGDLISEASIRLDGKYKGNLRTQGSLVIGEGAVVEADVNAFDVEIAGSLNGNVVALNRLAITFTGKLFGNARAAKLVIDEGAVFCGHCETQEAAAGDEPE